MSIEPDIDFVYCFASGYGNKAYTRSDIRSIYRMSRQRFLDPVNTEMFYDVWNGHWKDTAIRLHQVCRRQAKCVFVAHSWGCGHAYKVFEKQWAKCGRVVDFASLIDPVPRPFRFFLPGNLWAMVPWGRFRVKNAREVLTFRQVNAGPFGRRVLAGATTSVEQYAYGGEYNLNKDAPLATGAGRIVDAQIDHESIDKDERVQKKLFEQMASKATAWRDGA